MANRFTRVPARPVPPLAGAASRLLPLADLFMLAMLSRPRSGTLRTTWVTPATLGLSLGLVVIGLPAGCALIASRSPAPVAAGAALLLATAGAAAVAAVGLAQRRR